MAIVKIEGGAVQAINACRWSRALLLEIGAGGMGSELTGLFDGPRQKLPEVKD